MFSTSGQKIKLSNISKVSILPLNTQNLSGYAVFPRWKIYKKGSDMESNKIIAFQAIKTDIIELIIRRKQPLHNPFALF